MPPKIPQSLQPPKKIPTVKETKLIKHFGSLKKSEVIKEQQETQKELDNFNKNLTYENYQTKYNNLSSSAKALIESPQQLFQSQEYKNYQQQVIKQKAIDERNNIINAYNETLRRYGGGVSSGKIMRRYGLSGKARDEYIKLIMSDAKAISKQDKIDLGQLKPVSRNGQITGYEEIPYRDIVRKPTTKNIIKQKAKQEIWIGEVQQAPVKTFYGKGRNIVSSSIEKITQRKPREVLRFFTGSKKTIVEPVTKREFITDVPQIPTKFVSKLAAPILGEVGYKITLNFFEDKPLKTKVYEVPRGTLMGIGIGKKPPSFNVKEIDIPSIPKQVRSVTSLGTQVGLFYLAPELLIAPGFFAGGMEIATDPTLSTGRRLFGVAEAEVGLFFGGRGIKSLVGGKTLSIRDFEGVKGKRGGTVLGAGKSKIAEQKLVEFQKQKEVWTRLQATKTFGRLSRNEQLNILRNKVFKNRFYLDYQSLLKDVRLAENFMKEAGLTNTQISDRIITIFPQLKPRAIETGGGLKYTKVQQEVESGSTIFGGQSKFIGTGQYERTGFLSYNKLQSLGGITKLDSKTGQDFLFGIKQDTLQGSGQATKQELLTGLLFSQGQDSLQGSGQDFLWGGSQDLLQKDSLQDSSDFFGGETFGGKNVEKEKGGEIKPPISFFFPGERGQAKRRERIGYHAEVLVDNKYKRITNKPYTREGAKDVMARVVDNTVSAQGRIVPQKLQRQGSKKKEGFMSSFFGGGRNMGSKTKQIQLQRGDGYFMLNQSKFRDTQIINGKPKKMKNKWIEKRNKRLDTFGETQGLTVAQFTSRRIKRARGIPVRRTKKKRVFRI